jgi:hypothetical protein
VEEPRGVANFLQQQAQKTRVLHQVGENSLHHHRLRPAGDLGEKNLSHAACAEAPDQLEGTERCQALETYRESPSTLGLFGGATIGHNLSKIRGDTPMTNRITNRPPPVVTTPKPATTPKAAPSTAPAVKPAATGASTVSSFDDNLSRGVKDNSVGVKDNSVGVKDNSVGVKDHSVGVKDHSVGTDDPAGGVKDHSVGDGGDSSIELGSTQTTYEKQVKDSLVKYLEKPSYIRDASMSAATEASTIKSHVSADPNFRALPATQQQAFWNTFNASNTKGKVSLGAMLEGSPELLGDKDSSGKTLLDNLSQVATQKLNPNIAGSATTGSMLDQLVTSIANPDEIKQGTAPTCTVASMQFEMARDNPAEYARMVAGLAGPTGSATMAGGGTLTFDPGSSAKNALDGRDVSQAIFQSAAMDYANGGTAKYDPVTGENVSASGAKDQGLSPSQQTTMLDQLFGVKYVTDELPDTASRAAELNDLKNYVAVGRNRPVLMEIDQGSFNHAVTFEMMKDNKIYFRDPYGTLRSMSQDAFLQHIVAVHKPEDMA